MTVVTTWLLAFTLTSAFLVGTYLIIRKKWPEWVSSPARLAIIATFAVLIVTLIMGYPTEELYASFIKKSDPETEIRAENTEHSEEPGSPSPRPPQESESPPSPTPSDTTETPEPPTEPVEETSPESDDQTAQAGAGAGRDAGTPLTVDIEIGDNFKKGIDTWQAVHNMRVRANVFDQYGKIEEDCYANVKVVKSGETIYSTQGTCTTSFGLATRQYGSGDITITFDIETDWGATGSTERTITIITD